MRFTMRTSFVAVLAILILSVLGAAAQEPTPPPTPAPAPAPAPAAAVPPAAMVDEAKIVIDGKADGNGKIDIVVTPKDGAPMTVTVLVSKKMKDKEVADEMAKNLAVSLGANYKLDADGNTVKIKGKDKQTFSFAVGAVSVPGMSVKIK